MVAYLPFAQKEGKPLSGRVRQEFNPMAEGIVSMGVSAGAERGQDVQPYPVLDRSIATLTMREYESDPRVPLPDSEWEMAKAEVKDGEVVLTPSNIDLDIKGGLKPDWLYEFIYETEGSRVMNLGFLGIRDLLSLVIIEAKITSDDGTARNKVARIKELETQRNQHVTSGRARYEVVACIDRRGFRERREDMRQMLLRLDGKVFTTASLDQLIMHTRLKEFVTTA